MVFLIFGVRHCSSMVIHNNTGKEESRGLFHAGDESIMVSNDVQCRMLVWLELLLFASTQEPHHTTCQEQDKEGDPEDGRCSGFQFLSTGKGTLQ
jgi:hypothetical protein